MLSFVNSLRAIARRQPVKLPAARAMSSTSVQPPIDMIPPAVADSGDASNLSELKDFIYDVSEEQETLAAATGSSTEVVFNQGGAEVEVSPKGFPILKGFAPNQFLTPSNFTREGYFKKNKRGFSRRPLLGPDAATSRYLDVFHQMDINPLNECLNSKIMSRFVTTMGKIKGRNETNLTWKNQRRVGKAIRRAKMMGIIPVLSRRTLLYEARKR
ncbi:hypothetical protein C2E23DRAFT_884760 [Lenzites betulinus]|nr:hypothetical protein C2E23DRAFT_884760 [Lenzites betulinus]